MLVLILMFMLALALARVRVLVLVLVRVVALIETEWLVNLANEPCRLPPWLHRHSQRILLSVPLVVGEWHSISPADTLRNWH